MERLRESPAATRSALLLVLWDDSDYENKINRGLYFLFTICYFLFSIFVMVDLQKGLLPCERVNRGYFAHIRLQGVTSQGNRWENLNTSYRCSYHWLACRMIVMNIADCLLDECVLHQFRMSTDCWENLWLSSNSLRGISSGFANKADIWRINICDWQLEV